MSDATQVPSKDVSKQDCTCTDTCFRQGNPFPVEWSWRCKLLPYLQPHPGTAPEPKPEQPMAPIVAIRVGEDDTCEVLHLYAPGLPPGEHDLYPAASSQPPAVGPLKLDNDRQVFFYEQDHYYLSNFSAFQVRLVVPDHDFGGERCIDFDTSEIAYHWFKFEADGREYDGDHHVRGLILSARSSHEAFKIAEKWRDHRRPDWDAVKVGIMRDILWAKVGQHEYVYRKLLETGDRELVENSWRDDFWGWGPNRDGQNMLGKLWMLIRAELRASTLTKEGGQ